MEKWADFLISEVQFNSQHDGIFRAKQHTLTEENKISEPEMIHRRGIVENLENGKVYFTIIMDSENHWKKGKKINPILIDNEIYIRVDNNQLKADNLNGIPEFL